MANGDSAHGVLACPSEGTRWRTGYAVLIDRHWARASAELLHHVLGLDCRIEAQAGGPGDPEPTIARNDKQQCRVVVSRVTNAR
jgi:hypothetical protein